VWCNECKIPICTPCTISAKHKGHLVVLFEEARAFVQLELEKVLNDADVVHSEILKNAKALEDANRQTDEAYKAIVDEITQTFQNLLDHVTSKRDQLLAQLKRTKDSKSTQIQNELKLLKGGTSNLSRDLVLWRNVAKVKDNTEFFEMASVVMKAIKSQEKRPKETHTKPENLLKVNVHWGPSNVSSVFAIVDNISLVDKIKAKKDIQGIVSTFVPINKLKNTWSIAVNAKRDIYVGNETGISRVTKEGLINNIKEIDKFCDVAVDAQDCVYVSDHKRHIILKIALGIETTFAGNGTPGFSDGVGEKAMLYKPCDLTFDGKGNLLVSDNNAIRKITSQGEVTTIAGSEKPGFLDGIGASAMFNQPLALCVDADGNIFVADSSNHSIRKITPKGEVITLAGSGAEGYEDGVGSKAKFSNPTGLVVDEDSVLFVSDRGNRRIRKITPQGKVTTIAGSGEKGYADGAGIQAKFNWPSRIARDVEGNLYVTDYLSGGIRVIV